MRRPLRPLAGVIHARSRGQDPDLIEAHRRAERLQAGRVQERRRAEWRLTLLGFVLLAAFGAAAVRMARLAISEPGEPRVTLRSVPLSAARTDIVDRRGRILATNVPTEAVYTQPNLMIDAKAASEGLARIFPDLNRDWLDERMARQRFFWVRQAISPEQKQQVHDLGEPGLQFAPREMRVYPGGAAMAHILGAVGLRNPAVDTAELRGTAGVELWFDSWLRDPARFAAQGGEPQSLALSIDLSAQVALREIMLRGLKTYSAKAGAGVLMEVKTGRVLAMVSLPDFDPIRRPQDPNDPLLFNRAAQGVYELGSTFKPFTAAMVMELGIAGPDTMIDTTAFSWAGSVIRDSHRMPKEMPLWRVIAKSSNPGTARLAVLAGARAMRDILQRLGLFEPLPLELPEAAQSHPIPPERWSEPYVMRVAFGHSIAVTPVHLAAAYATLVNGGLRVHPTLLQDVVPPGEADRVIAPEISRAVRQMLRKTVTEGTAKSAEVPGYFIGGKTGSAEKVGPGGYQHDKLFSTFAGVFPISDPEYVLVISLDEPEIFAYSKIRRTAGWTAAPLAGQIIRRLAPLLGMRPKPDIGPGGETDIIAVQR